MKSPKETTQTTTVKSNDKPLLARRAIIKGAAGTLPTILTLQSGAALARSSNLIRPSTEATDANGRTLCLSERSVDAVYENGQIDLGDPAYGHVTAITERDYYREPNRASEPMSEEDMCLTGEPAYFKSMGWNEKQAPKGFLVSADACSSFAGIDYTEI